MAEGRLIVVDMDLETCFDRVNHDVLMERLARRIEAKRLLRIILRFLDAAIMRQGVVVERWEGIPQGGTSSPPWEGLSMRMPAVSSSFAS